MMRYADLQHNPVGYGRLFDFDLPKQN
jgi:hypothetical protein